MLNLNYLILFNRGEYSALLKSVIVKGDIDELNNVLQYNEVIKVLSKESGYFLEQAYKANNLHIAKFLLSYGIEFSLKNFAYLSNNLYLEHLYDIRQYLSSAQFDLLFNYIVTVNSTPLLKIAQKECYVVEDVLMSITFTNDKSKADLIKQTYSDLYHQSTQVIHDVLKTVALSNFKNSSLKIFMPFDKPYAYLNSIQTSDNRIFIPVSILDQDEQGFLMHELTHYSSEVLVNNAAKPFKNDDKETIKLYHNAGKEFVAEVLTLYNKNKETIITQKMIYDESITLRDICSKVAHADEFHIFSFNSRQNSKEHKDKLMEAYFKHSGTSDEHNTHFLKHYLDNVINKHKFNDKTSYFISRIADLCLRNDNELEYEPIAFAVELEVLAKNNNITSHLTQLLHNDFAKILKNIQEKEEVYECNSTHNVSSNYIAQEIKVGIVGESTGDN